MCSKTISPWKGTRAPHRAEELRFLLESSARLRKAVGGLFTPRVAPHSPDTWPGFHLGLHPGSEIDVLQSESDCNVGERAPLKCKPWRDQLCRDDFIPWVTRSPKTTRAGGDKVSPSPLWPGCLSTLAWRWSLFNLGNANIQSASHTLCPVYVDGWSHNLCHILIIAL